MKRTGLFFALCLMVPACGGSLPATPSTNANIDAQGQDPAAAAVPLTEADNGKTVERHTGDDVVLVLKGCPSCGYSWEVDATPLGEPEHTSKSTAPQGAAGGYSEETFTWHTAKVMPGTYGLNLHYLPPGRGSPVDHSVAITITLR